MAEFNDRALVDDGNLFTQTLGFFQVMSGQDDGCAAAVNLLQKIPGGAAQFHVYAGRRFIQQQQLRFMDQGSCDHQSAFESAGKVAGYIVAPFPQTQLPEVFLRPGVSQFPVDSIISRLVQQDIQASFK